VEGSSRRPRTDGYTDVGIAKQLPPSAPPPSRSRTGTGHPNCSCAQRSPFPLSWRMPRLRHARGGTEASRSLAGRQASAAGGPGRPTLW